MNSLIWVSRASGFFPCHTDSWVLTAQFRKIRVTQASKQKYIHILRIPISEFIPISIFCNFIPLRWFYTFGKISCFVVFNFSKSCTSWIIRHTCRLLARKKLSFRIFKFLRNSTRSDRKFTKHLEILGRIEKLTNLNFYFFFIFKKICALIFSLINH